MESTVRPREAARYEGIAPRHPFRTQSFMDYGALSQKALDSGLINVVTVQVDTKKIREVLGCSRGTALVVKTLLDWHLEHAEVTITPKA